MTSSKSFTGCASRFLLLFAIASSKNCPRRLTAGARCAGSSSRLIQVLGSFSSAQPMSANTPNAARILNFMGPPERQRRYPGEAMSVNLRSGVVVVVLGGDLGLGGRLLLEELVLDLGRKLVEGAQGHDFVDLGVARAVLHQAAERGLRIAGDALGKALRPADAELEVELVRLGPKEDQ